MSYGEPPGWPPVGVQPVIGRIEVYPYRHPDLGPDDCGMATFRAQMELCRRCLAPAHGSLSCDAARPRVVRTNGTGPRALDVFLDPLSGAEVVDELVET